MKRLFFLFFLLYQFISVYPSEHIKFMGLNMSGSIELFKDSLLDKGFSFITSDEGSYFFYGKFANEPVKLQVVVTPITNEVCKTIVFFHKRTRWEDLKADYFVKKRLYSNKYQLDKDYEFFSSPYEDGDGYELRALSTDKCHFISFFFAVGGYITINIAQTNQISVTYEDRENMIKVKEELEKKALKDI